MTLFFPHWVVAGLEYVQHHTNVQKFVNTHVWVWPASETLHFIGLCLLFGTITVYDLRLLGVGRRVPIGPLQRLLPWGVFGFVICLATGIVFLFGNYFSTHVYLENPAFKLKMALILLAGINVLLFNVTGLARTVATMGPGGNAPIGAKAIALTSLVIWIAVIFCGRFLPIVGDSF